MDLKMADFFHSIWSHLSSGFLTRGEHDIQVPYRPSLETGQCEDPDNSDACQFPRRFTNLRDVAGYYCKRRYSVPNDDRFVNSLFMPPAATVVNGIIGGFKRPSLSPGEVLGPPLDVKDHRSPPYIFVISHDPS